jgi:hypothetical protein
MHLLVFGRGNEAGGCFCLVNWSIAKHLGAARLRLWLRVQRPGGSLGMIEALAVAVNGVAIVGSQESRM